MRLVLRLFLLAAALALIAPPQAWAEGIDVETWSSATVEGRLAPDLGVQVTEELRSRGSGPYYNHTDIGFSRPSSMWFEDSGVGYIRINKKQGDGWVQQDRLYLNGFFRWRLGSVGVENRSRVEYGFQGQSNDRWQCGDRIKFTLPLRLGTLRPHLYVSDEMTINLSARPARVIRNRARVGLSGRVWGDLWADVFLQRQWTRNKSDTEGETKVSSEAVGLQLKLRF